MKQHEQRGKAARGFRGEVDRDRVGPARPFRVAAVQMKFATTMAGNLERMTRALESTLDNPPDAVLYPECALTGYASVFGGLDWRQISRGLGGVRDLAVRHRVNLLVGAPVRLGRAWYNCLVVFDRAGAVAECYAKCQLTPGDRAFFKPGDSISIFELDGVKCTAILCHERRYPELVRLGVMAGAQVVFHPNAGLDLLAVSKAKRGGKDGIVARAFENGVFYVFANVVGPQGQGRWSAGDSKIVAPDLEMLALADNHRAMVITAELDLTLATRKYALDSLEAPPFLVPVWREALRRAAEQHGEWQARFRRVLEGI